MPDWLFEGDATSTDYTNNSVVRVDSMLSVQSGLALALFVSPVPLLLGALHETGPFYCCTILRYPIIVFINTDTIYM